MKQKITISKLMEDIFMINQLMTQLSNMMITKTSTGPGDDYTTGFLLDFAYFMKKYRLIAADLSKQKAFDAILKQFNKLFLLTKQIIKLGFITFLNNQKKQN